MAKSITSRFTSSLVANLLRSGIAFTTGLLVARWLGPQEYGRLVFLLSSFVALRQLLDMGSSFAFFTLLSQRKRSRRFVTIFTGWVALQLIISVSLVLLLLPDRVISSFWAGESRLILVLALVATFMQGTVWSLASQMAEANRETHRVQLLSSVVVLLHLAVVASLWWLGELVIWIIFVAMAIEWAIASFAAARMYRATTDGPSLQAVDNDTPRSVCREIVAYCLPLIPYVWLGSVSDFADRWMLQTWGGARNQAYFGVSQQFAAVALFATASILRIFWKEVAEAHYNGNEEFVRNLYFRASRMLYFVGALMAGGLMPWAGEIISITVGSAYADGASTLMLMFLYPVHQSMGQIGGTMLYATGQVRAQVIIGMIFMFLGLTTAYFVLAPQDMTIPGLGLGAQGLVWKMVALQLVSVNVVAWYIARTRGWTFDWSYQPVGIVVCLSLGWGVREVIVTFPGAEMPAILQMVIAGVLYVPLAVGVVYIMPWIVGVTRSELADHTRRGVQVIIQRFARL